MLGEERRQLRVHVRRGHLENGPRRLIAVHLKLHTQAVQRAVRLLGVQAQLPAQESLRMQDPEGDVRVGHGREEAAPPVACGPRIRIPPTGDPP